MNHIQTEHNSKVENEGSQGLVPTCKEDELVATLVKDNEHANPPAHHRTLRENIDINLNLVKNLSMPWVFGSFVIFIAVELLLGGLVGGIVVGKFVPHTLKYLIEVLLILSSFFVGGAIIGFVSPGIRILEPALAGFFSVLLTLSISFFSPYRFMAFTWTKVLVGGGIAFFLALAGARFGEKLSAKIGNQQSKEYFGDEV